MDNHSKGQRKLKDPGGEGGGEGGGGGYFLQRRTQPRTEQNRTDYYLSLIGMRCGSVLVKALDKCCLTVHQITLYYIALHCITLYCIRLH